jgi:hypothetical protein
MHQLNNTDCTILILLHHFSAEVFIPFFFEICGSGQQDGEIEDADFFD